MRNLIFIIVIFFLILLPPPKLIKTYKGIIIPAYFYNETLWQKIISTKYSLNFFVIANVQDGPGKILDENYKNWISLTSKSNKKVLGYVYTSYSKRNINLVKNDIERWIKFYPEIKGFFIDEVPDSKRDSELNYYSEIYKFIKNLNKNFYVILNPGNSDINLDLLKFSDSIVIFEDDYKNFNDFEIPFSIITYNPSRFIGIVYNVPKKDLLRVYEFLKQSGIGIIYITDDNLPNPYDTLPSYYDFLIKLIYLPNFIIPIPPPPIPPILFD